MTLTRTDKLTIERRTMPVTFNASRSSRGKGAWRVGKELKAWREWAYLEGEGWELAWPVAVRIEHLRVNGAGMPDVGAPILAVKAAIDGLVDARVLPDDGPKYVQRLTFEAPQIVGYHGLRLTLTTITPGGTRS